MMFWPLNFTPLFLTFLNNYEKIILIKKLLTIRKKNGKSSLNKLKMQLYGLKILPILMTRSFNHVV